MKKHVTEYRLDLDPERHPLLIEERVYECKVDKFQQCADVVSFFEEEVGLPLRAEEFVYMLAMDTKGHSLGVFEIAHGTVNASYLGERECMIRLLMSGAASFIVVHNHPSGDVNPSSMDMQTAEKLQSAAAVLGLRMLDFLIIGANAYESFNECGYL